ncbi:MAG: sugar ABC transporter substrate-binding protein [Rubrivivax sp.]|nr:sugar ABC transporter substrate-binding protein [Rubrivivax sp.]
MKVVSDRILLKILLFLTLFVPLLSACSDSRTTITFVFLSSSPDKLRNYWKGVVQDFEAANPDVNVDLRVYTWNEGRPKIAQMVADGRPPDLARVATREIPEYVSAGWVELVDGYFTPDFRAQFFPLFIEEGARYQGRTFGLPAAVSARVLYYNQDLLAQAGYSAPPATWDELREVATAVSRPAEGVYGFGIPASEDFAETNTYFYYFLWGNGGDVFSPDGTKAAFDGPEGVEALTFLNELVQSGAAPPNPLDYTRSDIEQEFLAGKLAMVITKLGGLAPSDFAYGVAPIPYKAAPVLPLVEDTLIMFKTSEHKALTWRFIEFVYQDTYRLAYSELEGAVPEKAAVAHDPTMVARYGAFLDQLTAGRFEPLNIESAEIAADVSAAVRQVFLGQKSPQEALSEAAAQANERLSYSASAW